MEHVEALRSRATFPVPLNAEQNEVNHGLRQDENFKRLLAIYNYRLAVAGNLHNPAIDI